MSERDGHAGAARGREGIDAILGRLAGRIEETMDRVAGAVDRGSEALERRLGDALHGKGAATSAPSGDPAPVQPWAWSAPPEDGKPSNAHEPPDTEGRTTTGDETMGQAGEGAGDKGFASRIADGYGDMVERARTSVSGAVARGADAVDGAAGDAPWRMAGLDGRGTRIAREVLKDVVPRVAGDRVASVLDGAAMKGGVAGVGLLMRIPLKGFAVPFLLGITAVEAVRAVREVRQSVADVAARVDNEARSAEAYREGGTST